MIDAGRLDRLVTLEEPVKVSLGGGATSAAHVPTDTVWARLDAFSASDMIQAQAAGMKTTYRMTIRQPLGSGKRPLTGWRVNHEGQTMAVTGVVERGRYYYELTLATGE
jgi:head-tail adaptor